jgi:hypothetical protein
MIIIVTYFISRMGWDKLVQHFKAIDKFEGKRVGLISVTINSGNYQNSIVLKYNYQGIYLKPIFLFRLFHPPVLIPWNEIKDVRDKKILFINLKELVIGDPFIALITLKTSVYNKIERPFDTQSKW